MPRTVLASYPSLLASVITSLYENERPRPSAACASPRYVGPGLAPAKAGPEGPPYEPSVTLQTTGHHSHDTLGGIMTLTPSLTSPRDISGLSAGSSATSARSSTASSMAAGNGKVGTIERTGTVYFLQQLQLVRLWKKPACLGQGPKRAFSSHSGG